MLKINKTINLNATSEINGQVVAYMNASISTDGNSANINKGITNQDLYNENKAEVRADFSEFENEVYKVEDSINNEVLINLDSTTISKSLKEKVGK